MGTNEGSALGGILFLDLGPGDIPGAKALVEEYVRSLGIDLSFQGIEVELADFPSKYAPPRGAFLVAKDGARVVGCVGMKMLDAATCEMKRLYVADAYKGRGIGRELIARIVAAGSRAGYRRMRLDTLSTMGAAQALYRSFGFRGIPPYVFNPIPGAIFMEKTLGGEEPEGR